LPHIQISLGEDIFKALVISEYIVAISHQIMSPNF
jgi:hypothetical protein